MLDCHSCSGCCVLAELRTTNPGDGIMKLLRIKAFLLMVLSTLFFASCQQKGEDVVVEDEMDITVSEMAVEEESVPTRTEEMHLSVTAEVEDIDHETREITLMRDDGHSVSFIVGDKVQRLNEISVGDLVYADYIVSVAAELRATTEEELETPLTVIEDEKRTASTQPAGVKGRTIRAVCQVVGIDLPKETATLQGPEGNLLTILAKDPERLTKVKIGDTVIVTYTETLAVALAKVDQPE